MPPMVRLMVAKDRPTGDCPGVARMILVIIFVRKAIKIIKRIVSDLGKMELKKNLVIRLLTMGGRLPKKKLSLVLQDRG